MDGQLIRAAFYARATFPAKRDTSGLFAIRGPFSLRCMAAIVVGSLIENRLRWYKRPRSARQQLRNVELHRQSR
jgi:hypothetical protein